MDHGQVVDCQLLVASGHPAAFLRPFDAPLRDVAPPPWIGPAPDHWTSTGLVVETDGLAVATGPGSARLPLCVTNTVDSSFIHRAARFGAICRMSTHSRLDEG